MVRLMQADDMAKWDAFVKQSPNATFFHLAGWQNVLQQAFGHDTWYFYAESRGKLEGILPLAEIKSRWFGHSLSSLPFCVYGGIVASSPEAYESLDLAAQTLAQRLGVDHLEYRNRLKEHDEWEHKSLYATFRKAIDPDPDQNMVAIPRKQRAMVRKGMRMGLQSDVDDDIQRFYPVYANSVHRLGTPVFSKKYFELLKNTFADDCEILTITQQNQVLSSVMSFFFRDEVLPYYGGSMPDARDVAGNDFMYWELMRRSGIKGNRIFDFGRSKEGTGSYDFKKNWGFDATPLHYEYKLYNARAVPDVNPLNPKYQLMIKLWQRLPLAVANKLGPHIVKNVG